MKRSNAKKIRGQGMSEYLILVALVAVAAIAAVGLFGGTARSQLASISQELSGQDGTAANTDAQTDANDSATDAQARRSLSTVQGAQLSTMNN